MKNRFFVGAVMALTMSIGSMHPAMAQEGGIDFVVEPAPGSQTSAKGGYFVIDSRPGAAVEQAIALRNDSGKRLVLKLDAVDATTGPYGGVSYGLEKDVVSATGTWLTLDKSAITLQAGESETVGFEVEMPGGADSGEYVAGISVWSPAHPATATKEQDRKAGATISVQTRRIVAVQFDLPGPSQPQLVISGVQAAARSDGVYLEIGIANSGRALTKGEGVIEVASQDFEQSFDVDTFVPKTAIAYPVRWTESVAEGEYDARVEIDYDGGVASWEGTFTVGQEVLDELAERGVAGGRASSIPSFVVALVAVALAGTGTILLYRSRSGPARPSRRRQPATRDARQNRGLPPAGLSRRVPPPPPPASPPPPPPGAAGSRFPSRRP